MARIRIEVPEHLPFFTTVEVRITDLNYADHLSNHSVLAMMHEGRQKFFQSFGWKELDADGLAFIMGDCAIEFKSEAFHGEVLKVEVGAFEFSRVSFDLLYRLSTTGENPRTVALGKTGMIGFNYGTKKVVSLPQSFREKIGDPAFQPNNQIAQ